MPFRLKCGGVMIECDSAKEARDLVLAFESAPSAPSPSQSAAIAQAAQRASDSPVGNALLAIRKRGADGISAEELATEISVNVKGIGSVTGTIRRLAELNRIDPADVVRRTGGVDGTRFTAGPRLDDLIRLIVPD